MDRVGVIGLGKMGLPIAQNLMDRGFGVIGYRRSGSPELAAAGGIVAASAAEVAAAADVLLSIVPDADAVEEVITGPDGTLKQLRHDWEAELAVVIGTAGKDISAERAVAHVAAYCVANDVTARGYHRREVVPADAFAYDWFAAKSNEGSLPLGPGLTPAFLVPDPQDLRLISGR
jgi:dihydrodipicolinate reductase